MISAVKQKDQISATDVIPRPQAVGISWYGVQNHTPPQEIATPLRARNDEVVLGWCFCMGRAIIGSWSVGLWSHPTEDRENLEKPVDNSKIRAKIYNILQRDTKKKQPKTS